MYTEVCLRSPVNHRDLLFQVINVYFKRYYMISLSLRSDHLLNAGDKNKNEINSLLARADLKKKKKLLFLGEKL